MGGLMKRRLAIFAALALAAAIGAAAAPIAHRTLANGLEVFAVENHAVPLATVCVVFRGGASAQAPETAGLFHLYEHMLFDGNEKYPTQASFMAELNRMGVTNWNGGTGAEYIDYFITVPSSKLAEGVEFWSWAVKKPVFDPGKLEREKQVVLNEIKGYHADPDSIAQDALESRMFPERPWRKNIDGPEANIEAATVGALEAMRDSYYIPRNAALLVGGDVTASEVFALAEKWLGDWSGGAAPSIGEPPHGGLPPGIALVYPDENYYQGVAGTYFRWRGPDVLRQAKDTYASDILLFLLTSPVGKFKAKLMDSGLGLYDPEYIGFAYPTARDGGNYQFSTFLLLGQDASDVLDRAEALRALVVDEFELIAKDPAAYFGDAELEKAKTKLIDQNLLSEEVASGFVTGVLTFWWSVASTDYYFDYEKNCRKVSWTDISDLIRRYFGDASAASEVRLKAEAYAAAPAAAERARALGYEEVGADNAFWWQK
jgi:zinc protease